MTNREKIDLLKVVICDYDIEYDKLNSIDLVSEYKKQEEIVAIKYECIIKVVNGITFSKY